MRDLWYIKWNWSNFFTQFLTFPLLTIIPLLFHTHLSWPQKVCNGLDQTEYCYSLSLWVKNTCLPLHTYANRIRKLISLIKPVGFIHLVITFYRGWSSLVSIATMLWGGWPGSNLGRGKRFSFSPKHPGQLTDSLLLSFLSFSLVLIPKKSYTAISLTSN
jgi:hypothetical protein